MNTINRLLLKAKHWQLFIITFVIPVIVLLIMLVMIFGAIAIARQSPVAVMEAFHSSMGWLQIISLIAGVVTLLWMLSIGLQIRKMVPVEAQRNTGRFIFSIVFLLIFSTVTTTCNTIMPNTISAPMYAGMGQAMPLDTVTIIIVWIVFILATILSIFCQGYAIYYTAKTYKSAELQKDAKFEDYVGEFFLILFSPIGLWVLQPNINKMAGQLLASESAQTPAQS